MTFFAVRARGSNTASLRIARRITRVVDQGQCFCVVGEFRGLEANFFGDNARDVATYRRREGFVAICQIRLSVVSSSTRIANVQPNRQSLLRADRGAFRSDQRRANVSNSAGSAIGGRRLSAPIRVCDLHVACTSFVLLSTGAVYVQYQRAFMMQFSSRVGFARLPHAA